MTSNPTKAKEVTVSFGSITDMAIAINDVLWLRLSAKVTAQGGHSSAVGLRLYYDAAIRPTRFGATFTPVIGGVDADRDGVSAAQGDCADSNAVIYPGATESCNNIDENCNGQVDEGLGTLSCGQGTCEQTVAACINGQPAVCIPGTPKGEICENGIDEDGNGSDLPCVKTLDISITGPANLSTTNQWPIAVTGTVDPTATALYYYHPASGYAL